MRTDSGLVARVLTKDGWSTQADWRFRSTGGEVAFTIGLVENNLLGTASSAAVRYRKTPDRTSVTLAFRRPRLFAGAVGLAAVYEDRSDGRVEGIALEQPFYSLTSQRGFRLEAEDRDERVLQFFEGADEARDTLSHRYSHGARLGGLGAPRVIRRVPAAGPAGAGAARGLPAGGIARGVREDRHGRGRSVPDVEPHPSSWWTKGYAGFAREEDVDLGLTVRAGVLVAPEVFGYERDGVAPLVSARLGVKVPGGFGYLEGLAGGLYDAAGLDSGSVQLAATAVLQPVHDQVGILHIEGGWLKDPIPGASSISGWAPARGPSGAMPSPATGPTSAPPNTGSPWSTTSWGWSVSASRGSSITAARGTPASDGAPGGTPASASASAPADPPTPTPSGSTSRAGSGTTRSGPAGW